MLIASISGPPIVYSWKGAVIDCLSLAGAKKGDLVVDLGCGNGYITEYFQ
jgi:ubiquinone/menaquinone biosynthesis C-methylase UbiE